MTIVQKFLYMCQLICAIELLIENSISPLQEQLYYIVENDEIEKLRISPFHTVYSTHLSQPPGLIHLF